jgi:hypothetical protein
MKNFRSRTIALAAGSAIAAAALGTGVAYASSSHTQLPVSQPTVAPAPVTSVSSQPALPQVATTPAADSDTVQQGDQTTPDAAASTTETSGAESPEAPGTETDGPGGHADGPGNVDHQFNGNE